MKAKHVGMILVALMMVGFIGFSATSYAGGGRGGGYGGGPGAGNCPHGEFGGQGFGGNLTDEEIGIMQKERNAFLESNRELRGKHYQKELELRTEVAKQNPDAKKATELQKEVSGLKAEIDQKRLEHQLKVKKDYPQLYGKGLDGGFGPRGGMGMGPGGGKGPGRGPGWQ